MVKNPTGKTWRGGGGEEVRKAIRAKKKRIWLVASHEFGLTSVCVVVHRSRCLQNRMCSVIHLTPCVWYRLLETRDN